MLNYKDYCDYDTCVALKELGFKEKTLAYYTSERFFHWRRAYIYDVAIPDLAKSSNIERYKHVLDAVSLYEAQKWLREEKGVIVGIINNFTTQEFDYYVSTWEEDRCRGNKYTTYENALLRGIKEAVKILKEK